MNVVRRFWKWAIPGVGLALGFIGWWWLRAERDGLGAMESLVRTRFPLVKQVSPQLAHEWLKNASGPRPQLLDVRTEAEFRVSRIEGAVRIEPELGADAVLPRLDPGRPVVVYCAVGYRSSDFATRLIKAGATNVVNIEGSIFAWANAGLPLVCDTGVVSRVHTYNETFGRMVKPEYRAVTEPLP